MKFVKCFPQEAPSHLQYLMNKFIERVHNKQGNVVDMQFFPVSRKPNPEEMMGVIIYESQNGVISDS